LGSDAACQDLSFVASLHFGLWFGSLQFFEMICPVLMPVENSCSPMIEIHKHIPWTIVTSTERDNYAVELATPDHQSSEDFCLAHSRVSFAAPEFS